jgi:hypothetical protein
LAVRDRHMVEKKVGCEAHLQHGPRAAIRLKVLATPV